MFQSAQTDIQCFYPFFVSTCVESSHIFENVVAFFFAEIVEAIEVKKGDQMNLAVAGDFSFQISVGSFHCL